MDIVKFFHKQRDLNMAVNLVLQKKQLVSVVRRFGRTMLNLQKLKLKKKQKIVLLMIKKEERLLSMETLVL